MCSITKATSSQRASGPQGQIMSAALIAVSILFSSLWARGLPLSHLSTFYFKTACVMVLGFLVSVACFVNYYSGQKLRQCSKIAAHLASMSRKTAPSKCIADLDKIANKEGLSSLWKTQVLDKNENLNILLTGVTGYVGKAFLFQLLREISIGEQKEGGSKKKHRVYVMARAKERKQLTASQRLEMIRDEPMFKPYKKLWNEVVVPAQSGDLQEKNCGMQDDVLAMLAGANISHVVHCAADVNFNRPLADSAGINISPALQLSALAQKWPTCKRFVHCSTAFVNPGTGSEDSPMAEQLFSLGKYDPEDLYASMVGDQKLALAVKKEMAFPNNYVFTKCVAEHLVVRSMKNMELKIVRPAIVGPAWALPEPGWNGEKPSTVTALFLLWGTRVIRFAPLAKKGMPMIPVDVVANAIIHAVVSPPATPEEQIMSTTANLHPVTIRNLIWSHKSPKQCISGYEMANEGLPAAVLKQHFSATETAISLALIDAVYKVPQLFPVLHLIFNLGPLYILQLVCWVVKTCGIKSVLEQVPVVKLLRFSDMISLYKPYMGRDYYFESSINVPESLNMHQYTASLFKATHNFIATLFPGTIENLSELELLPKGRLDLWWALTSHNSTFSNRIMAYLGCKILRETHGSAIVDVNSLGQTADAMMKLEAAMQTKKQCVLLAATYNSPMDNVLAKYVHYSMAGIGTDTPTTFSDADFQSDKLGLKMGSIKAKSDHHINIAASFRDSKSSEAFLRTLTKSSGEYDCTVVPLSMKYTQGSGFVKQAPAAELGLMDMVKMYWHVCIEEKRAPQFSAARISYGNPCKLDSKADLKAIIEHVQQEHSRLGSIGTKGPADLQVTTVSAVVDEKVETVERTTPRAPSPLSNGEEWKSPKLVSSLNASNATAVPRSGDVDTVVKAISTVFDAADYLAVRAKVSLQKKKVENPSVLDLVQEMESLDLELKEVASSFIFQAAASLAIKNRLSFVAPSGSEDEKKDFQ